MTEPHIVRPSGSGREEHRGSRRPAMAGAGDEEARPVFLRSPADSPSMHRIGGLVRLMGLEHYSSPLLTQKVRTELSVLAAVLLATFLFELAAWSFFWNGILVGRMDRFSPVGSTIAGFLGLLFAGTILFFERQVITTDVERQEKGKRVWVQAIRVVAILVAGFIVAHAVDVLAFRVPVERLLHVEAVEAEVERLSQDIDGIVTAGNQDQRLADLDRRLSDLDRQKETGEQQRIEAEGEMKGYEGKVELLGADVHRARQELIRAQRRRDSANLEDPAVTDLLEDRVDAAFDRYRQVSNELSRAEAGFRDARARVAALGQDGGKLSTQAKDLQEIRKELVGRQELLRQAERRLRERLRRWVETLLLAGPRDQTESPELLAQVPVEIQELWPDEWRVPLTYEAPEQDFFQRIDAVYRLAFAWREPGERLGWAGGAAMGLEEPLAEGVARSRFASSKAYLSVYLGIHLAAFFIPFLVFVVKWFLMPKEVDDYFSARHQAEAGDAGARTVLAAEKGVRDGGHER